MGILILVLLAALVYWLCTALGLPPIIAIIITLIVILGGGWGRGRWY